MPRISLTSLLLTALTAFQAAGWLVAWHTARWEAHFMAQAVVQHSDPPLTRVTLAAAHLEKCRIGKREIVYAGRLYDIRSAHAAGDSVHLELYHDHHEQHLYGLLGQMLRTASSDTDGPATNPLLFWLAHSMSLLYLVPQVDMPSWSEADTRLSAFPSRATRCSQHAPGLEAPPPDC